MKRLPGVPGPGEDKDPANVQAEGQNKLIPDGEMPGRGGGGPAWVGLVAQEADRAEAVERDALALPRRAGSESRALLRPWYEEGVAEHRRDANAEGIPHEAVIDPAQDNAGSQPDL